MTNEKLNLGQELGRTHSIPESIQMGICAVAAVVFLAIWAMDLVSSTFILFAVAGCIAIALNGIAHCIPTLRTSLTVCEQGLETIVQGKSTAFAYDRIASIEAESTHYRLKFGYVRTRTKIKFLLEGKFKPHVLECETRPGQHSAMLVALAIDKCSQAIQRRLLTELESQGAIRWRNNALLTEEGIVLVDSASTSRLIHYRDIEAWKIVDNDLKIWKTNDALPFLVLANDSPNFVPLFGLFESLNNAAQRIDQSCDLEPSLASTCG